MAVKIPTPRDISDPILLEKLIRTMAEHINQIHPDVEGLKAAVNQPTKIDSATMAIIQKRLSSTGSHPLNLTGLPGVVSQAQIAKPVTTTAIANLNANLYEPNTIAIDTGANTIYYNKLDANGNHTWQGPL